MAAGDLSLAILITAQNQASGVIRGLASDLGPVGTGLLVVGGLAVAAGVAAVKMAGDFQSATTTLVTGAGESAANLDMVRKGILDVSVATGSSTDALTKAMFLIESAGYHGAAGLQVLRIAAEGAKVGNADLAQVADVLTTTLHNYGLSASSAVPVTNSLIVAVQNGKMTMDDLNQSMTKVLPVAAALHVPLSSVEGALSTMAISGDKGAAAGTHLAMMFKMLANPTGAASKEMKAMGINSVDLAKTMQTSLPDALKMIQDAVAKHFVPGSVEYNRAIAAILGGSKSGIAGLEIMGKNFNILQGNVNAASNAFKNSGSSVNGWAMVQQNLNFKLDQAKQAFNALFITIGTMLLPVITNIVGAITPVIAGFTKWISSGDNLKNALEVLKPVLIAIGIVILYTVVPALVSMAVAWITAAAPIVAIVAVVALVVAAFKHWYDTNAGFKAFIDNIVNGLKNVWTFIQANFLPVLQKVGSFLLSTFKPIWDQLVQTWQQQVLPALKQLWSAIQPLMPIFAGLGIIILGIVVIAFGILIGVIKGVVQALSNFIQGLAIVIGGVIKVFTGIIQIVSGVVTFIVDLCTGNFSALGDDLHRIWDGIVNIFSGAWDIISGIFEAAWGVISGFVSGLVTGIIGFFQNLFNTLVGHSIIPDMVNAIVNWFKNLVSWVINLVSGWVQNVIVWVINLKNQVIAYILALWNLVKAYFQVYSTYALALIQQMVLGIINWWNSLIGRAQGIFNTVKSIIMGVLASLPGLAWQFGVNLVNSFANGIRSMIGNVQSAASSVVNAVKSFLGFSSPAKEGPGRDADKWAPNFVNMYVAGLLAGVPKVQGAFAKLTSPMAGNTAFALSASANQAFALSHANHQTIVVHVQPGTINLDGKKVGESTMRYAAKEVRVQGAYRGR